MGFYILKRVLSAVPVLFGLTVIVFLIMAMIPGDPATAIARYAQRNKIDLIVMGTRGLGNVKGMLMGSVSRKVANACNVNLLIVR